jgi:tRNA pseudouridine55 synthase
MSKRKANTVHGWVIVDKPAGITSTDTVSAVKRIFGAGKAGHAGTLDPMATGVLAVALGEATKTVPFAMAAEKTYHFGACWGEARDSDDAEGLVIAKSAKRPTDAEIKAMLPRFVGTIRQAPPAYSAIKVNGERAYDLARGGEAPQLDAREVAVHRVELIGRPGPDHSEFEMVCGKGAYVRAWVRDLAQALGTVGHVSSLRRTAIGGFSVGDAIPLEKLKALMHSPAAFEHLRPISAALDGIPAVAVSGSDAVRLRSGNAILLRANLFARIRDFTDAGDNPQGLTVFLSTAGGELRPFRVFNFGTG